MELWVQPLCQQWVQSTQSQRALLGVGASTTSCEGAGRTKIGGVFSVRLKENIAALLARKERERTFSCGSLVVLFP